MDKFFKSLILVSTISYTLWFFQPYNTAVILDQDTLTALEWVGFGGNYYYLFYVSYLFLIFYIVSAIGMLIYLNWARTLFIVLTIASILLSPLAGLSVSTTIDSILGNIIGLCDGAIIFMAYFSSVSSKFTTHNKSLSEQI